MSEFDRVRTSRLEERRQEEALALEAFVAYVDALTALDGETLVSLVTEGSLEWFDEVLDLAQTGDYQSFESAPIYQVVRALELRTFLGDGVLELDSGADALRVLADNRALIRPDVELPGMHVEVGTPISGSVRWGQGPSTLWTLQREGDQWRVDIGYAGNYFSIFNDDEGALEILVGSRLTRTELLERFGDRYGLDFLEPIKPS